MPERTCILMRPKAFLDTNTLMGELPLYDWLELQMRYQLH